MSYRFYSAQVSKIGSRTIIVTSAFANAGGYPRAECFIVIPGRDVVTMFYRLSFDVLSFESSPVNLDEEFMFEQALSQAEIDLSTYIEQRYSKYPQLAPEHPEIKQTDLRFLVSSWVNGLGSALHDVYDKTEHDELRNALKPLLGLPAIDVKKI
jgi:hypothetical protein